MLLSLLAALSVSLIAGCGTSVAVKGTLPTPVVRQIPLHVGVLYTSEFKEFLHTERVRERGTYKIDIGQQNYSFFQRLFEAMFVESREVSAPPLSTKDRKGACLLEKNLIVGAIKKMARLIDKAQQMNGMRKLVTEKRRFSNAYRVSCKEEHT